jgi:hypothetical protein
MPSFLANIYKILKCQKSGSDEKDFNGYVDNLSKHSFNSDSDDNESVNYAIDLNEINDVNDIERQSMVDIHKKNRKSINKFKIYKDRYSNFIKSPRVHFVYETFFYTVFLLLFSYMLLCEMNYYKEEDDPSNNQQQQTNRTHFDLSNSNINNSSDDDIFKWFTIKDEVKRPSYVEYILLYWIFTFIVEEMSQV